MLENVDIYTCYYCHLHHPQVEAGGIYHCPNPLCPGPGAAPFREKCTSYTEVPTGGHTVDPEDLVQVAITAMATCSDEQLRRHAMACVSYWIGCPVRERKKSGD